MKKIRVAVSGAGNRACSVVHDLHEAARKHKIVDLVSVWEKLGC